MSESAASFRDPAGSCKRIDGRVLRTLRAADAAALAAFLQTPLAQGFVERRQMVWTRRLDQAETSFEHEPIPFPTYPYEWPPEMLWAAGALTLELAQAALDHDYGLKDASPYNVLFRGAEPVFVDIPSFERRQPGDPTWRPYGQFVRTFLLPLLANRRWGLRLADVFTTHRDGLEPAEVHRFCSLSEKFAPGVFSLVTLPALLDRKARAAGEDLYKPRPLANEDKARFVLKSIFKQLTRTLQRFKPAPKRDSAWSAYMDSCSYSGEAFEAKQRFVETVLGDSKPARVLDAGANTGHFSLLAARSGAQVVAIDSDPDCVGAIWNNARAQKLPVLPLVVDLSRPSPAMGWRNQECASFLERATHGFDCVLMLALIHHLLVTERIPLQEILALAADLTTNLAVIEYVGPQDTMFRQLTRGRAHLHEDLTEQSFEAACAAHFQIIRSLPLPGTHRRLYALKRLSSRSPEQ